MRRPFPVEFSLSWQSCILGSILVMLLPLPLLLAAFTAAAIHECCHLLALVAFRVQIFEITIRAGGAQIQTAPMMPGKEFVCAAAGPAGSLLCLLAFRRFPLLALCGFVQGLYNLLPVYPMDGGRMVHCLAKLCAPVHGEEIARIMGILTIFVVTILCVILWLHTGATVFLMICTYFVFKTKYLQKNSLQSGLTLGTI